MKFLLFLALLFGSLLTTSAEVLPLAGSWAAELDRQDVGLTENWAQRKLSLTVQLPGGLTEQGIGDRPSLATKRTSDSQTPEWYKEPAYAAYTTPENFKHPYWLTPDLYYVGAAWFQREIEVPASWAGQRVVLFLERPHWETRVWIDGHFIGANNGLGTPHEYDLGLLPPGKHQVSIRIDNRLVVDVGAVAHSVGDHTQGNWLGIVGRMELRTTPPVWIDDLQLYPDSARRSARVVIKTGNRSGVPTSAELKVVVVGPGAGKAHEVTTQVAVPAGGGGAEVELALGAEAPLWDEFQPALHTLTATLTGEAASPDSRAVRFGLREIATAGTQFTLNGRKIFFRGTLECAIFPKTGHPPTDVASWKRILGIARAHGLNHLRFHSWCPPEAAFVAADEMGFYYQIEASAWTNSATSTVGDGKPVDRWIYEETDRILKYYGNHPSFLLMPYGNEPGGKKQKEYLGGWVAHYHGQDSRRLFTSGSGWPELPQNQFHVVPQPRIQLWGAGLKSRINARPPETTTDYRAFIEKRKVPVISHEIGQWCVYPNFDEIPKYTGYLKPRNFEIFRDKLVANGMGALARPFLMASGKLQALCYKEDIESALRTPGMGGFQLLDLHDFPGQGTALVGVLDPFWEEKGYITAKEYSRFCNAVVPLARLTKRVFTTNETFAASLELANFGAAPLTRAALTWRLVGADGREWAAGQLEASAVSVGNDNRFGEIRVDLQKMPAPAAAKLIVGLKGTDFENDWDIWVYPPVKPLAATEDVLETQSLNEAALGRLNAGGKVLLLIPPAQVKGDPQTGKAGLGFSSIFWNTVWTKGQLPHTLGILCDPQHPVFKTFPTEYHSNWQWWYLIHHSAAMGLKELPAGLPPIIRVIDDWFTARPLGLLFEARVGTGKLMVGSIDLQTGLEADPVRSQFRRSLLAYMNSKSFAPTTVVTAEQINALIEPKSVTAKP